MVDEVKDRFHCANDKVIKLMWELDSDKGNGFLEFWFQEYSKTVGYKKNQFCRLRMWSSYSIINQGATP